jgi:hypothetical protein
MRKLIKSGMILMVLFTACTSVNSIVPQTQIIETKIIAPSATEPVIPTTTDTILPPTPGSTAEFVETIEKVTETPDLEISTSGAQGNGQYILIDHSSVEKFSLIPDDVIADAAKLRVLFRHASVGENIRYGLECMYGNYPTRRPNSCGPFFNLKYDNRSWIFQSRGNPGWIEKVDDFVRETKTQQENFDVLMFTLGYLDGFDGMSYPVISDPDNFQTMYIDKLESLETGYPDKKFVWWTMSLAQEGHQNTTKFNEMLRSYASENGKVLVDLADIETHDLQGEPCFDKNQIPIVCSVYTDEKVSGHLNEVGRDRMAKAFWYLMARLTGWLEA